MPPVSSLLWQKTLNMRYLSLLLIALSFCLTACNHNEEPPTQVNLPIRQEFLPINVIFSMSDSEFKDKIKPWLNKQMVVNSIEELPNDPIGFTGSYYKINFKENTLLLAYQINDYNVISVTNRYYRNRIENTYNWSINLGVSGGIGDDEEDDKAMISRYAILVRKLPGDGTGKIYYGLSVYRWDWEKIR